MRPTDARSAVVGAVPADDRWHVLTVFYDGTDRTVRIDGEQTEPES